MILAMSVQTPDNYKYGFVTNIEADEAPKGLNEDIIKFISKKKNEPEFMLKFRLKAFEYWKTKILALGQSSLRSPDWDEGP